MGVKRRPECVRSGRGLPESEPILTNEVGTHTPGADPVLNACASTAMGYRSVGRSAEAHRTSDTRLSLGVTHNSLVRASARLQWNQVAQNGTTRAAKLAEWLGRWVVANDYR